MHFEGSLALKAAREKVFDFLMDPNSVSKCIPGFQKILWMDDSGTFFNAEVKVGISFIKGTFTFKMSILDKVEPSHGKLKAHGMGMGSAVDLDTSFDLLNEDGGTKMNWKADATVSGNLASVGSRMMEDVAQKQVSQLFDCVRQQLEK